eukprot:CAMPEP_0115146564 /NCGR_PEP_ID=MMETSP0227-20121206/62782_1 /TAXON_ID=89957 /ORGANISM="Polarella glacialis, Strain CCMP 1383" /LENGTH=64 /DNA_ID=CAMNT_0002556289 /DNA_START=340 /DNA_END=534 /DNA_ORIENTATION=-
MLKPFDAKAEALSLPRNRSISSMVNTAVATTSSQKNAGPPSRNSGTVCRITALVEARMRTTTQA